MRIHHAALCVRDIDASLAFWRDGLGLEVLMDHEFEGDWPTLLGPDSETLRSIFLGDAAAPDAGVVELVDFHTALEDQSTPFVPTNGFFLLSFNVDLTATLERLATIGVTPAGRETTVHGVRMAVVQDPDGVRVELIDLPSMPDLPPIG